MNNGKHGKGTKGAFNNYVDRVLSLSLPFFFILQSNIESAMIMNKIWAIGFLSLMTIVLYQRFVTSTKKTSNSPGRFGRSYLPVAVLPN